MLYTVQLLKIPSQVGPAGALARRGEGNGQVFRLQMFAPQAPGHCRGSVHINGAPFCQTPWLTASVSPTLRLFAASFMQVAGPLQPAHHCFRYFSCRRG